MKKKIIVITLCLLMVFSFIAYKKKNEQPPQPIAPAPIIQGPIPPEVQQKAGITRKTQIIVPKSVKGKWKAVKLVVENKVTMNAQEYTINLNSTFKIPNSNLSVFVGEFLPDFKIDGSVLTSASNEPKNPAVAIRVFEGDKQIFPTHSKWGWLFSKLPSVHPLNHPIYSITLKEGVSK